MTVIVTSFAEKHWDEYARACVESARVHWPADWQLVAYTDMKALWGSPFDDFRFRFQPLPETVHEFARTAPKEAFGTVPHQSWKSQEHERKYSFKTDAVRFCHKPFALIDYVTERRRYEPLIPFTFFWLDADVLTIRKPRSNDLDRMLPVSAGISRLARPTSYSETGFLGFRMPDAKIFFSNLATLYLKGTLFKLTQWHDSWAIDFAIRASGVKVHDAAVGGQRGTVWPHCLLSQWCDHLKGPRKSEANLVHGAG